MECSVEFLKNSKGYFEPGEKLNAEVTLKLKRTESVNSITCEIQGLATCWFQIDKSVPMNSKTQKFVSTMNTNRAKINYLEDRVSLLSSTDNNPIELTAGEHKFTFLYLLPPHLPSSFGILDGSIKYSLEVNIERTWTKKFTFPMKIIRPLNLNDDMVLANTRLNDETLSNMIYISASIQSRGYVPGQIIIVKIEVNNQSRTRIKEIQVALKKIISLNSTNPEIITRKRISTETEVAGDPIPPSTAESFEKRLVVPPLEPSILNCAIVQVTYEVRVKAKIGGLSRSPKCKLPITIGTIPFHSQGSDVPLTYEALQDMVKEEKNKY